MAQRLLPAREDESRARAAGVPGVLLYEAMQGVTVPSVDHRAELHHLAVAVRGEGVAFIEHERDAAAHSRGEIPSGATEHDDATEVRLTRGGAVEHGVADDDRLVRQKERSARSTHDQAPSGQALAHVVVRFALELERKTARRKRAEALARRTDEAKNNALVRQTGLAVASSNLSRQHRAHGTVFGANGERVHDALPMLERGPRQLDERVIEDAIQTMLLPPHVVSCDLLAGPGQVQQRREIEGACLGGSVR